MSFPSRAIIGFLLSLGLFIAAACNMDVTRPEDEEKKPKDQILQDSKEPNQPYYGDYTIIPGGTPSDYGFSTDNGEDVDDHFAITEEGYIDTSPSPGGWNSAAFTPDLGLFDRNVNGGIAIEWRVMYPCEKNEGYLTGYRELNKLYIALVDANNTLLYRFMYRPLTTPQEQQTVDMELTLGGTILAEARTRKLVPYGLNAEWIYFKAEITSSNIGIFMDHDGNGYVKYLDVADDTYSQFRKLHFQYRTGEDADNYFMLIDGIAIYPLEH